MGQEKIKLNGTLYTPEGGTNLVLELQLLELLAELGEEGLVLPVELLLVLLHLLPTLLLQFSKLSLNEQHKY